MSCNKCGGNSSSSPSHCYGALSVIPPWQSAKAGGYAKGEWVCFENRWYRSRVASNTRHPYDRTAWSEPMSIMALMNLIPDEDVPVPTPCEHPCWDDKPNPCTDADHPHGHPHGSHHTHPKPFGTFPIGTEVLVGEVFPDHSC